MSFDFSTLVTDRTQADVNRVKQITEKIKNGTASESELAEFNSAAMKGAYNYTDLNRVTAAMEALKAKLEGYGYAVPGYQRIEVPHVLPESKPTNRLPEGYTELTYIQSSGTQYIDTGFKPNQDTRVVMDAQLTTVAGSQFFFGTRTASYTTNFSFLADTATALRSDYGEAKGTTSAVSLSARATIDKNKNVCKFDSVTITSTASTFQCGLSLFLFSCNEGGTAKYFGNAKLYSCQIYDNGTLARDYVPCINPDGVVGLYDLVTAAFFGNSGTGSFVAGAIPRDLPDGYTQVAYIESTGSQYINSNYTPTGTTTMKATVLQYAENANVEQAVFGHSNSGFEMGFGATNQVFLYSTASASYYSPNTVYDVVFDMTGIVSDTSPYKKLILSLDGGVEATSTAANNSKWKDGVITLFALKGKYNFTGRLYCASIYDSNNVCVRDFVPCKNSGGVIGLYDLANDVFYQNAGSGAFAAGDEVAAPAAAAVAVVSNDLTEYDPYTWYEFDWPTPETMTVYLLNVVALRSVFAVMKSTPSVPKDAVGLMVQEANNIEKILVDINELLIKSTQVWFYSGDLFAGEV